MFPPKVWGQIAPYAGKMNWGLPWGLSIHLHTLWGCQLTWLLIQNCITWTGWNLLCRIQSNLQNPKCAGWRPWPGHFIAHAVSGASQQDTEPAPSPPCKCWQRRICPLLSYTGLVEAMSSMGLCKLKSCTRGCLAADQPQDTLLASWMRLQTLMAASCCWV